MMPIPNPDPAQQSIGSFLESRFNDPNPAVRMWGLDPEGRKCGTCDHMFCHYMNGKKRFCKCAERGKVEGITSGSKTDHRVRWNACRKYKPEEETK